MAKKPLADNYFLGVAAGEAANGRVKAGHLEAEALRHCGGICASFADTKGEAVVAPRRNEEILQYRADHQEAFFGTLAGDKGEAALHGVAWVGEAGGGVVYYDGAGRGYVAEEGKQELALTLASKTAEAEEFAFV